MVAEGPLGAADVRRDGPDEGELRAPDEAVGARSRPTTGNRSPAMSDASISSGTFSGSGAIAASIRAGGPPRNTVAGSGSPRPSATA